MKAITLRHPWPFAICHWGKRIENRTWLPPRGLLGQRIAIHGAVLPPSRMTDLAMTVIDADVLLSAEMKTIKATFQNLVQIHGQPSYRVDGQLTLRDILLDGICATAIVHHTIRSSDDKWFMGPIGWVLTDVIVLPKPIPCKGAQGLWEVPADVLEQIEAASREAVKLAAGKPQAV